MRILRHILAFAVFSAAAISSAPALDLANISKGLNIDGSKLEYNKELDIIYLRGRSEVSSGGVLIRARNIVIFQADKEVYAEGDVMLREPGGSTVRCETLYYNLNEMRGEANKVFVMGQAPNSLPRGRLDLETDIGSPGSKAKGGSRATVKRDDDGEKQETGLPFNRIFIQSKSIRALGVEEQQLVGVTLSTDNAPKDQVYRITSAAARLKPNEKVESWHNVLWLGKIPVFYLPYVIKDLRYDWPWMRLAAGSSSNWGMYALSTWGIDLDPEDEKFFRPEKLFFDIDWREDRGWAFGADLKYEMGRGGKGYLDTYWLKETAISSSDDAERAREDNEYEDYYKNDERWKFEWEHYQNLPGNWDLRAEANIYSDRDFRYEYFRKEYNQDKEPETALNLRNLNDDWVFELMAKTRVNDFLSQEEYLPELRFTLPGYQIGESDFYVRSDTRVGYVGKKFDDDLNKNEVLEAYNVEGYEVDPFFRLHNDTRIYRPINIGRFATFTPYIGGRVTYYEDMFDEDSGNTSVAGLWGAELAGRFYGKYNNGRVRHLLEPSISYTANEDPTFGPDKVYEIDEVDLYDELHYFTFKLHNGIQVKRMMAPEDDPNGAPVETVWNLIDFDIETDFIPQQSEADNYNYGNHWTDVKFDLVYRPNRKLKFYGDLSWNTEDNYISEGSAGVDWTFNNLFRAHLTHRYYRGDLVDDPDEDKSSQTTFALRWLASDRYTLEYAIGYEWAHETEDIEHGQTKQRISVIRNMKVFELAMSYIYDAQDEDHSVYFTLSPIGIDPMDRATNELGPETDLLESRYTPSNIETVNMP